MSTAAAGSSLGSAAGGRYELLRRLAVGGMGEIHLARERGRRGFSRLVVIKQVLPELAAQPGYLEMFVDEARIIGQLAHPNVCQIHELGDDGGLPFLALEYVRGENLTTIYNRAHRQGVAVPRGFALRVLTEVAWALDFVHDARDVDGRPLHVVHRDISPHNVMVGFRGEVKLMDFGIARAEGRSHQTAAHRIKGKLAYMAPEQVANQPLDRRVDVFALGVMLWELTLGRRLFAGGSEVETFRNALRCEVPPPRSLDPAYPADLEAIVLAALRADRDARTPTAGALARALTEHQAAAGAMERDELIAVMAGLFPAEAAAGDDAVVTSAWTEPDELELATTDAAVAPATVTASAPALAPPLALVERRRGGRWLVAAAVVAAGALAIAGWRWRASGRPAGDAPVAGPTAGPIVEPIVEPRGAPIAAPPPAPAVEPTADGASASPPAAPPTERIAAPTTAGPQPARARRASSADRTLASPAAAAAAPTAAVTTAPADATAAPAAARAVGTLAVSSTITGLVVIDGVRRKTTPFQTELPAGEHRIEVELVEGAGTLRATAQIAPGRKTKCRVVDDTLACSSPP